MGKTAKNWADRPHMGPGNDGAVHMQKAIAMGMAPPKPERTTRVDLTTGGPGKVHTPGWFSTHKK